MRAKLGLIVGLLLLVPTAVVAHDGSGSAEAAVRPKVTLTVAPAPIAQTASGYANRTAFQGRVTPRRPGAKVTLQRKVGTRWVAVGSAVQNSSGIYQGVYVGRATETLRAVSKPGRVNRLVASAARKRTQLKLIFGENFNGSTLNATRWQTRHQDFSGRRMCAKPGAGQARLLGDGKLTLSVRKLDNLNRSQCPYGRWLNGMIGSKARFKYGVYAARVKFQAAPGMHGAFWLQGPPVTGAEIDVAEYFGAQSTKSVLYKQHRLGTLIHYTNANGEVQTLRRIGSQLPTARILGKKKTPANSYHVYAVHWTPTRYKIYLDGKLMLSTNKPFVSKADSELVLSLLSSDHELSRLKNPKSVVKVDWVRAWRAS